MNIYISGGTGFVGGHVCRALRDAGHNLRLLIHRQKGVTESGVACIEGDATRPESLAAGMTGCDAVINLIGIIREFPSRGITFEKLHIQATKNMLKACRTAGIGRYLQMSALGTGPEAVSEYHRSKWSAEELVRASGLEWTIFRPSLIFGPEDAFINMLAAQIRRAPVMPVIGNGDYRLQPIHVDDVARCFARALEIPETVGRTYELCGSDRLSYVELLDMIAATLGRTRPLKPHIPVALMKLVTPYLQKIPQFPITMDQLQMLLEENIGSSEWQQTFGFEARRLQDGIAHYLHKT